MPCLPPRNPPALPENHRFENEWQSFRSLKLASIYPGCLLAVSSADGFRLVRSAAITDAGSTERLERMVGFRNTVIHQYTEVDIRIVEAVIVSELDELLAFADRVREHTFGSAP